MTTDIISFPTLMPLTEYYIESKLEKQHLCRKTYEACAHGNC